MRKYFSILFLVASFISNAQFLPGTRGLIKPSTDVGPNLAIQGYGIQAQGADVTDPTITVNTLSAGTGIGTIYWAINTATGGTGSPTSHKKIVFTVNGTITTDLLTVDHLSFVTIDGAGSNVIITAPNNDGISFEGNTCNHIIVKNLHFADCGGDGANVVDNGVTSGHDIAFTNCSFYGNGDGNIDIASGATNVTVQYCIIGYHTAPAENVGSGGMLITGTEISCHHNLFNVKSVYEGERCPLVHGNYSNAYADVRNNLVYQWGRNHATGSGIGTGVGYGGSSSGCGCYSHSNVVNNYYYTPSVSAAPDGVDVGVNGTTSQSYVAGNISGNGYNFNTQSNHAEWTVPFPYAIDVETTCEAVNNILNHVGPDTKNSIDIALIAEVTNLGSCAFNDNQRIPYPSKIYYGAVIETEEIGSYKEGVLPTRRKSKFNI